MRSIRGKLNAFAVSGYKREPGINEYQELDLSLAPSVSDVINLEPRREDNRDEMTGKEEADIMYDLGCTSSVTLNFEKAQPQHFALLYGYGLGDMTSETAGFGWLKTIKPMKGDLDLARSLPSMTAAVRYGQVVAKERFASMFVNSVTATFAKDSWVKLVGECLGTGKSESSVTEKEVIAAENATALTLPTATAGTDERSRVDAIHQIAVELSPGVWHDVEFTAVSDADPAEITITAPGTGTDSRHYKVLYAPKEEPWMAFPPRVFETPMRVSQTTFRLGGKFDGRTIQGGREMGAEINSLKHRLSNNGQIEFVMGAGGAYASRYFREGREQTLALDREFRDYMLRNYMQTNEYFAAGILSEGDEYEPGHRYSVEIIFPRLALLKAPISIDGKRMGEKGDMAVLEDGTYGSVIVKVKNLAEKYAAK